jgi:HTH-type transcriptional regulator/antitoxin HigA
MTTAPEAVSEEYLALVRAFPLEHVRDDTQLEAALPVFGPLFEKPHRTPAEDAYVGALADLIETYENATVVFPTRTGRDALASLIRENGLRQTDLLDVFPTQSILSEILNGKRKLTLEYMARLAARFHVPPSTFMDPWLPSDRQGGQVAQADGAGVPPVS